MVAERFTSQTPGSSGVCSLYLGEHRLTVTGDFNVFGAVTLDHPLATLDVRGNLSIDSPTSIIELTQGTLRAGGNVTFLASSGTGQPSIALILDGNGQQRIMVPSVIALEATSGDVTASVDVAANIAVSGLFSLARPISFISPALTVTTSFVRFEAGYVSAGNEPQILADSCDASGYLATQPPGAIDPCQDVFAP